MSALTCRLVADNLNLLIRNLNFDLKHLNLSHAHPALLNRCDTF